VAWNSLFANGIGLGGKWSRILHFSGGTVIGDIDVGYGPARAFRTHEVKAIADRLKHIDKESLRLACDRDKFVENEIYPQIWDEEPESCFGYILDYFEDLKTFISKAAEHNRAMIVYIN